MIGKTFKSEMKTSQINGVKMTQLTNDYNNFHFYFTDNSFMKDDRDILFMSDRASKELHNYNFFKMNLDTGDMVCLSDETGIIANRYTKTPDGDIVVYICKNEIKRMDTATGKIKTLYSYGDDIDVNAVSISCDKKYLIFLENEKAKLPHGLPNYGGFMDRMFEAKKSRIMLMSMAGGYAEKIYEDTHHTSHLQFSPFVPYIATYCHEGPWNLVHQRIWAFNLLTRSASPILRQGANDCVGHEFWTRDGLIFFENRQEGHDGTITEDKTQAYAVASESGLMPYVGFADFDGNIIRTIDMPVYCNHYHANNDNTLLVGDAAEHIMLIDISGEKAVAKELCAHGTSWRTQSAHCHPTFGWNGDKILYASDTGGKLNIYMAEI